jgi:hypothetical protein
MLDRSVYQLFVVPVELAMVVWSCETLNLKGWGCA